MAQVVQYLPGKAKALSLKLTAAKKKKKIREGKGK
jgi:hypothetical protein